MKELYYFTLFICTFIQYNGLFVLFYLLVLSIHIIKCCKESMNIFDRLFFTSFIRHDIAYVAEVLENANYNNTSFIINKPLVNPLHRLLPHLDEFVHLISADVWSQMD